MRHRLFINVLLCGILASLLGCGTDDSSSGPGGLTYWQTSIIYPVGQPISVNTPHESGGPISVYTVAPALPSGLALNSRSGAISGTPDAVAPDHFYVVTGSNESGATTSSVQIAVTESVVAPAGLSYAQLSVNYEAGIPIAPNPAHQTGGAISTFTVSPILPTGLVLDPVTGVISGTPGDIVPAKQYQITGSNAAGSVSETLQISVTARATAPTSLTYARPFTAYGELEAAVPNQPIIEGGVINHYSVSPALPTGLSLNTVTGEISGTASVIAPRTSYVITGSNSAGSVNAALVIAAVKSGTWMALASPAVEHTFGTATLLPDGTILVAGGAATTATDTPTSTVEIYTPWTDLWHPAASMNSPRLSHTATLLPNGKVLVTGGFSSNSFFSGQNTAEIYDPSTGLWNETGSMMDTRAAHTATLLTDGKVLVAGGQGNTIFLKSTTELYDPSTGAWSATGSLSSGEAYHTATLLRDGRVLMARDISEVYDPGTRTWSVSGTLNTPRYFHAATLLLSGEVLLEGGESIGSNTALTSSETYDPVAGAWAITGPMTVARAFHTASLLADGRVLIAGGNDGSASLATAELYDPLMGSWAATGSMLMVRAGGTATLLPNEQVFVVGGSNDAELFVP